jgi:hypothetical protein
MNTNGGFVTSAGNPLTGGGRKNAGAPTGGTDEVQTLTGGVGITSGTFALTFVNPNTGISAKTAAIVFNATAAAILLALQALVNFPDTGGAVATGGAINTATPVTLTFADEFSGLNVAQLVVDNTLLVGGTVVAATTVPGVAGTGRGAPKGDLLNDTTTPKLYQNTGTATKPTWQVVGSQT